MKHIFIGILTLLCFSLKAQVTEIWNDDFDVPGDWNITEQTGQNDSDANVWVISDEEGGVTPPNCGTAGNGDPTLHISCQGGSCIGTGAIYNAGDAGMGMAPSTTNIRAALTNPISTTGETGLELVFDWIGVGQNGSDYAELEYSTDGGANWNVVWTQTPGAVCGGGQGEWAEQTVTLPVAAENQADLRFAFHWRNDNDGSGSDPSFAVNNLRLMADGAGGNGPTADFTASSLNVCEGDCINLTDNSTGNVITSWNWTFNGASTATSTDQNPTNICYPTAGTYDIVLEVTDADGTDQVTRSITVTSCSGTPPTAAFTIDTSLICAGDCISFTDESTGDPTSWSWTFEGGTPSSSSDQNPEVCFDTSGTFDVTLTVSNDGGTDQVVNTITVRELPSITGFGDTIIDIGGAAVIEGYADNGSSIFWEPDTNIVCDTVTCNIATATPLLTTTYYPSVVGLNGCIGRDTVLVVVNFEEIVEVPSAFSPNEDGVNDKLHVLGLGIVNMEFRIFNRYGQLVFETDDIEEGWDGTMQGEPLNQGVFVWTLSYDLINGASGEKSGNVTLVK